MNGIWVDTFFWVALNDRRDAFHVRARALAAELGSMPLFISEAVIIEFVNFFSEYGPSSAAPPSIARAKFSIRARLPSLK